MKCGLGLLAVLLLAACAPTDHRVIMRELNTVFARMPHECVPLGWNPVPVATGMYYSGESVELREESVWLPALWIGRIRMRELSNPQVRVTYSVLNELVRINMLERLRKRAGLEYHLTLRSLPYYYDESHFRYVDGNWVISTIYAREIPLPRLADASVWPRQ